MTRISTLLFFLLSTLFITPIFSQCENYSIQMYSDVNGGGPSAVDWVLTNEAGDTLFSGTASFGGFTFIVSETVCLDPGVFTIYFTGNAILDGETFIGGVQQGPNYIFPTNEIVFGDFVFVYEFNTESLVLTCDASFVYTETETPGLVEFESTSTTDGDSLQYAWDFDGNQFFGDSLESFAYTQNGNYPVCLNIAGYQNGELGCVGQYCATVEVTGFGGGEICPQSFDATPINGAPCGEYMLTIPNAEPGASIAWFPDGPEGSFFASDSLQFSFPGSALYEVCMAYQSELCPSGNQVCQIVAVAPCNECPTEIEIISGPCGDAELSFGFDTNTSTVVWDWGDGDVTINPAYQWHPYPDFNNNYLVCADYWSAFCPDTASFCINLDYTQCFNVSCPVAIDVLQPDCNHFFFSLPGADVNGTAEWSIDGAVVINTIAFDSLFDEAGIHTISVSYSSADCPLGTTLETTIEATDCVCPDEITISNLGCFLYQVSLPGGLTTGEYDWSINTAQYSTPSVNYTIPFPSSANVNVTYIGSNCPEGVSLSTTLSYDICGAVCPGQITKFQTDCNIYQISVSNFTEETSILWTINGEQFEGNVITYELTSPGSFAINAIVSNPGCPNPVTLNSTIDWSDCESGCPTEIYIDTLSCNVFQFSLNMGGSNSSAEWQIGTFTTPEYTPVYTNDSGEPIEVSVFYTADFCAFGTELTLALDPMVCADECPDSIAAINLACNTYQFTLDVSEPDSINWNINGANFEGNNVGFILDVSGVYDITATYNGGNCISGIELTTSVEYEACEEICPSQIVIENTCNEYHFSIAVDYPQIGAIWTVNGEELGTGISFDYTLPAPGDYVIGVTYTGPDCPFGSTLSTALSYQICNTVCPSEILIEQIECNNYHLVLDNVPAEDNVLWYINGQPILELPYLDITLSEEEDLTISAQYFGIECTDGIFLETVLSGVDCDPDTCLADFEFVILENGVVEFTNTSYSEGTPEYAWTFGEGNVSDEINPTFTFESNGTYTVCLLVTTELCSNEVCQTVLIDNLFICPNNEIQVTVLASFPASGSDTGTITFYENDIAVSTQTFAVDDQAPSQLLDFCLEDGCYEFELSVDFQMEAEAVFGTALDVNTNFTEGVVAIGSFIDSITYVSLNVECPDGVYDIYPLHEIELYPNPVESVLTIRSQKLIDEILVYDLSGKMIYRTKPNQSQVELNVSHLPAGIYQMQVIGEMTIQTMRFEVIR
ncbi:MAG: PKD domain-containing protein [Flavobacteriales bacterium]